MHSLRSSALKLSVTAAILAGIWLAPAFAAEEGCSSCDKKVTFSGDFAHRGNYATDAVQGAPPGTEFYYRDGIFGANFTATISGVPDGKYTITVGVLESSLDATNSGQRVFDISAGNHVLAKDLDIIKAAGGPNKVYPSPAPLTIGMI